MPWCGSREFHFDQPVELQFCVVVIYVDKLDLKGLFVHFESKEHWGAFRTSRFIFTLHEVGGFLLQFDEFSLREKYFWD